VAQLNTRSEVDGGAGSLAVPTGSRARFARWWRRRGASWLTGYAFVLPALIVIAIFHFWPILQTIRLSFYQYDVLTPPVFTGLDNYRRAASDPVLGKVLLNTVAYAVVVVPILVIWPFLVALLVNRAIRGMTAFRTLLYIPVISPMVVAALLWKQMLQQNGMVNRLLESLHIIGEPVRWLTDPDIALFSIMGLTVWKASAYYMVIYLAGLQALPRELEEAAMIDGANVFRRILNITIPLMRPFMALVAIIALIGTMQVFAEIYLVTEGGPGDATRTLVFYVYNLAFEFFEIGYAITISVLLLVTVLVMSIILLKFFDRGE
jgi:putative chitobiose transport system permease protein